MPISVYQRDVRLYLEDAGKFRRSLTSHFHLFLSTMRFARRFVVIVMAARARIVRLMADLFIWIHEANNAHADIAQGFDHVGDFIRCKGRFRRAPEEFVIVQGHE